MRECAEERVLSIFVVTSTTQSIDRAPHGRKDVSESALPSQKGFHEVRSHLGAEGEA